MNLHHVIHWSPGVTIEQLERQAIFMAFKHFHFNKTATANSLGISIRTLDNKFDKYAKEDKAANEADIERKKNADHWLAKSRGHVSATVTPIPNTPIGRDDVIQKKIAVNNESDKK
jgi:hypothetical protein